MKRRIDLNADLGEGCGDDAAIMKFITRCNIACGGHAGDTQSMSAALQLAKENAVLAGAHPSFPDPDNFGRKEMDMSANLLSAALAEQIHDLQSIAAEMDMTLSHVKPHGALYNLAARNMEVAKIVARVTSKSLPGAALLGPPGSKLEDAANAAGIDFLGEAFADRAYENDGSLRSRAMPGALITDDVKSAEQAKQIAQRGVVTSHDGHNIPMPAKTICLHSDTPGALKSAQSIRAMLQAEGIEVSADV